MERPFPALSSLPMSKLLVVDDDPNVCGMLQDILQTKGYSVDIANDTSEAASFIKLYGYEAVILDWQLGGQSGAAYLKGLRASGFTTPVIMLTARKDEQSCVYGLEEAGADDYLTKPFSPAELLARLKAIQRRPGRLVTDRVSAGDLHLDRAGKQLRLHDKSIQLHKQEAAIIELLMKHPGELFSTDVLLARLWPSEAAVCQENVRVQISNLRRKLRQIGAEDYLTTVHRLGYKMCVPPHEQSQDTYS